MGIVGTHPAIFARYLSARWQRENHKHQVGIKALSSLCSNYVSWLTVLSTNKGPLPITLIRAFNRLVATIVFAQNLFPTKEIIEKAQTLHDNVRVSTFSENQSDQQEAFRRAKDGFREFAISVREQIGLA